MNAASSISQIASLMADPKRSAMLWALIDGTPRLANELAVMTGLTSSSACAHLSLLSSAGLLRHEARGRKRYFRLATPQVGAAVEALASVQLESARGERRCTEWNDQGPHLGGVLGQALFRLFLQSGWMREAEDSRALHISALGIQQINRIARVPTLQVG